MLGTDSYLIDIFRVVGRGPPVHAQLLRYVGNARHGLAGGARLRKWGLMLLKRLYSRMGQLRLTQAGLLIGISMTYPPLPCRRRRASPIPRPNH